MQPDERQSLIRQYAADQITWHELRERGFDVTAQVAL